MTEYDKAIGRMIFSAQQRGMPIPWQDVLRFDLARAQAAARTEYEAHRSRLMHED